MKDDAQIGATSANCKATVAECVSTKLSLLSYYMCHPFSANKTMKEANPQGNAFVCVRRIVSGNLFKGLMKDNAQE